MSPRVYTRSDPRERFMQHVLVGVDPDACWEWTASLDSKGYGQFGYEGRPRAASRVAAMLFLDLPVDSKLHVCHRCDNRTCVNPDHLFIGTNRDNMDDRNAKGRVSRGSQLPHAKLNERQVVEIRCMAREGWTHSRIAKRYGVSTSNVSMVVTRKTWRHVP